MFSGSRSPEGDPSSQRGHFQLKAKTQTSSPTSTESRAGSANAFVAARLVLPLALLGLAMLLLIIIATPASAGSDDACPLGYYEVDDDYIASNPLACQYKTLWEVANLSLTPTDVIHVHNGSYIIAWNITTNGLSVIGDSTRGV